jgi:ribonuclease HI
MEQHAWRVEFTWVKAHVGQQRNETADQMAKEAANSKSIEKCYSKLPKSAILKDLRDHSTKQWQSEWSGVEWSVLE